jgi:hypothetical protein
MQKKARTLEAVEVKEALQAHGQKLRSHEEQLLRMTQGAGLPARSILPRKSDDPAVRAKLEAMELELLGKWKAHMAGATRKDRIVRALKKKG